MLNKIAFANSLTAIVVSLYLILYGVRTVSPKVFEFLFNALYGGINVAVLFPREFSIFNLAATIIVIGVSNWIFAYLWATLYNRLAK